MAERLGFPRPDPTLIATAISEVARNIVVHVGRGEIVLTPVEEPNRYGLIVVARDRGPGIRDVEAALRDDFSGRGGLGLGLPGARRLMDDFEVTSGPDEGTTVTMTKWRFRDELARLREERRKRARRTGRLGPRRALPAGRAPVATALSPAPWPTACWSPRSTASGTVSRRLTPRGRPPRPCSSSRPKTSSGSQTAVTALCGTHAVPRWP